MSDKDVLKEESIAPAIGATCPAVHMFLCADCGALILAWEGEGGSCSCGSRRLAEISQRRAKAIADRELLGEYDGIERYFFPSRESIRDALAEDVAAGAKPLSAADAELIEGWFSDSLSHEERRIRAAYPRLIALLDL
jgi:DNA-directed RNA polymerase subunit RPC12/RpoP